MSAIMDAVLWLMRAIGAPGVGVAVALETFFPPVPSEVVLPLAGYAAYNGHYSLFAAIAWATVGSVASSVGLYRLSAAWGLDRLRSTADRIPLMSASDMDRSMAWFERHGTKAVLLGRLVPGVRSLVSIPAGIQGMPMGTFIGYTFVGSLLWNSLLIMLGYELGAQWRIVEDRVGTASNVVWIILGLGFAAFAVRRLVRRRQQRQR